MLEKLINNFRLRDEKENFDVVIERIEKDSVFKGTNLLILVFAIFIASLGLNVNSTAVIIGAMLISPLMGPIMGLGLGFGINDLRLIRKAVKNFTFAVLVGLLTSFVYFLITPLNDAYSELLARTSPTIYDVLIAFFGGLAGIIANSSKQKGNVIPGVAIATALMPPLCTAGYGLATMQFNFFFGAFYLFTINTVFIALATLLAVKLLRFPVKHLPDPQADLRSRRIIIAVALLTLIPSIYYGYVMVEQNRFVRNANLFVEAYSSFEGIYLLNKTIDAPGKNITLIYGGNDLDSLLVTTIKNGLHLYNISDANLVIKQGFSFMRALNEPSKLNQLTKALEEQERKLTRQQYLLDSIQAQKDLSAQIYRELKIQYPQIISASLTQITEYTDTLSAEKLLVTIKPRTPLPAADKNKLEKWLKQRLKTEKLSLVYISP